MRDNRGIDRSVAAIDRRFKDLWSAIEALRSERRAVATTVGSGNWVIDGGDVLMLDTDGSVLFRLGAQTYGDRGISISRESGVDAFTLKRAFVGTLDQNFELKSREGDVLVSEEALGYGLGRPLLDLPMTPVMATATSLLTGPWGVQVPVSSASWTTTHQAWFARQNYYVRFKVQIAASDATTACEVQVIDVGTGNPLQRFFAAPWVGTRAAGSTAFVAVDSDRMIAPGDPDDRVSVALQVRRTAGAGTLQVALIESHGS